MNFCLHTGRLSVTGIWKKMIPHLKAIWSEVGREIVMGVATLT